jgi:hypothetical protein
MDRVGYAERRPSFVPGSLSDLAGPAHGLVVLPGHLGWTGRRDYDLDDDSDRAVFYERVLVEAIAVDDLTDLLDAALLRSVWRRLFLPRPVRRLWERRVRVCPVTDLVTGPAAPRCRHGDDRGPGDPHP